MTTASSAAAIESSSGPPFFADGAEPRFHWERTAGQVALSVDPHQRTPRLERAVLWLMGETQRASGRMKITTELVRQVHQIINPDLGMYAGLCTHETLPLMARLESLYQAREMHLQDLRDWHTDFLAISPFPTGNHEAAACVLAALSYPAWSKFLVPGQ